MITPALLKLRVSLLLKNEKAVRGPGGYSRWDFEPEHRLVWTDAGRVTHLCVAPSAPIPDDYAPETLCRSAIESLDLRLVDYHELGGTNCPGCARAEIARDVSMPAAAKKRRFARRPRSAHLACSFLLGGLIVGLSEFYALSSFFTEPMAETPLVHHAIVDQEPSDEVGEEF